MAHYHPDRLMSVSLGTIALDTNDDLATTGDTFFLPFKLASYKTASPDLHLVVDVSYNLFTSPLVQIDYCSFFGDSMPESHLF